MVVSYTMKKKNNLNYAIYLAEEFLDNNASIEEILEEWNHNFDDTFYKAVPYSFRLYEGFQHYYSDSDIREKEKSYRSTMFIEKIAASVLLNMFITKLKLNSNFFRHYLCIVVYKKSIHVRRLDAIGKTRSINA